MTWYKGLWVRSKQARNLVPEDVCIYAVGDIHGRLDLLLKLTEKILYDSAHAPEKKQMIVFLGDYIDRGSDSASVIEFLQSTYFRKADAVFLRGNHDQVMLDFLENADVGTDWIQYGGRETLLSYRVAPPGASATREDWVDCQQTLKSMMPGTHLEFLRRTRTHFSFGDCFFVHAGVDPKRPIEEQTEAEFLWIRDAFMRSDKRLSHVIVHGHTPEARPTWDGRRIGIDTGAYLSGCLTAARISGNSVEFLST